MFVFTLGRVEIEEYEVGPEWFERTHAAASPELLAGLEAGGVRRPVAGPHRPGLRRPGAPPGGPVPRSPGRHRPQGGPCGRCWRCRCTAPRRPPSSIDRAAAGDAEAVAALMAMCDPDCVEGLKKLTAVLAGAVAGKDRRGPAPLRRRGLPRRRGHRRRPGPGRRGEAGPGRLPAARAPGGDGHQRRDLQAPARGQRGGAGALGRGAALGGRSPRPAASASSCTRCRRRP